MQKLSDKALLGLAFSTAVLMFIFTLMGVQIELEFGLCDGRLQEMLRTRYPAQPMLMLPCAERGCEKELERFHITLRGDQDGRGGISARAG